jgi:glycosyltransferase involved in cell wall biosynthesis
MRILIHDFGGYPFPVQLSRALAERGHTVAHVYCGSLPTTPNSRNLDVPDAPPGLTVHKVELDRPLDKFSFIARWRQENQYGRLAAGAVSRFRPDVMLSANTPLDAQRILYRRCRALGVRFVFWLQDLIGVAAHRILRRSLPVVGEAAGRYYLSLEGRLLRQSDGVVLITKDFCPILERWGVEAHRMHVVENWAPLAQMPVRPKDNAWSRAHGLADRTCLLYAGTMGMKHNPDLLLQLARRLRDRPEARVVVVSEGLGADWLRERKAAHGLDNLVLIGFQPDAQMPDVFGTADVLTAVLEPEAGVFSVPSKVLAYLCAARPVLLAVPAENLAARIVVANGAGAVVPPTDPAAYLQAAAALLDDPARRAALGRNARRYAERTFDIEAITDRFERILASG